MKLAYIANTRFPSEKAQSDQVMAMCSAFAGLGHKVTLFVPDRAGTVSADPFEYYQKPRMFTVVRVPCLDALRWRWLGRFSLWIQTATFVRALRSRLVAEKPDVIFSRELYVFAFGKLPGQRIWESHALPKSTRAKRLIRQLDGIVTLTHASAEQLKMAGVPLEKILIEPDAVDPSLFYDMPPRDSARQTLHIPSDEFLCLYVGKFTTMGASKGLEQAIEAVLSLRKDGEAVRLLAVGGTTEEVTRYLPAGKAGKRHETRSDGIGLMGHQPQASLKNFYAAADALLMPFPFTEHYAYFMSPLKLFEYLMSGVPIVATDLPSVREIVDDRHVFFAEPGDAKSLAGQIFFVKTHPDEARQHAEKAKALSIKFTWSERARRIGEWISGEQKIS